MEQLGKLLKVILEHTLKPAEARQALDDFLSQLHRHLASAAGVREDEAAILLLDSNRNLKFFQPRYLAGRGAIPVSYSHSFVTKVMQAGQPAIENRFQNVKHLQLFEEFKKENPNALPIQKMMCIPLQAKEWGVYGALELSRKGNTPEQAGPDWREMDLESVMELVQPLMAMLGQLCRQAGLL